MGIARQILKDSAPTQLLLELCYFTQPRSVSSLHSLKVCALLSFLFFFILKPFSLASPVTS